MGVPEGLERFGGIDLDQAVFAHVDRSLDGMLGELDTSDPATRSGLVRLREECRRAKEALSTDTDTVVPVVLPTLTTDVRVTRAELESMARPRIAETVAALQRGVASAGLTAGDLDRVLLVGGSSRMPLVAEMVHQTLGVPVVADANPKLAIAYGAALAGAAARATGAAGPGAARATAPDQDPTTPAIVPAASPSPAPQPPTVGDDRGDGGRTDPAGRTPPRRMLVPAAVALLVLALAGGAVALTRPDAEPTGSERLAAGSSTASTTGATDGTTTTTRSSASTTTATPSSTTGTTAVPTTSPPVTSPPTTAPPATLTRERMTDASGSLSAEVPIAWQSRLTNAVQLNGVLAVQVSAAADQAGYAAFTSPGVTVLAADAAQADPPDQVLALIGGSFTGTCQAQPVASFSTAVMSGVTQRWTGCGGGVSTAHVHVGTSSTGDIYLVSGVTLGLADEVAYQRAVETAVRR
jgi:hypothetical protein